MCWWWGLFEFIQYAWNNLIYERYISEPIYQTFIDVSTIAKISVIVMDESYHGFYLHCRRFQNISYSIFKSYFLSPFSHAEGSMQEIIEQLHKEEAGLTTDRGLEGAPEDVQSFELFLTERFKSKYDKLYANIRPPLNILTSLFSSAPNGLGKGGGGGGNSRGIEMKRMKGNKDPSYSSSSGETDRLLKGWRDISRFLRDFIDESFSRSELTRDIREPTFFQKILKTPPEMIVFILRFY